MTLTGRTSRLAAFAVPYVAVLIGLYALESAWVTFLLYHAGIVVVLSLTRGWSAACRGFRVSGPPSREAMWLGVVGVSAGVIVGILMHVLWTWYGGPVDILRGKMSAVGLDGGAWISFALYHAMVNPWFEEAYWRGALGRSGLFTLGDIAFAGYHVLVLARFTDTAPIVLSFLVLIIAAAFWRLTLRRTTSLWPATWSHMAGDMAIMVVLFLHTQRA